MNVDVRVRARVSTVLARIFIMGKKSHKKKKSSPITSVSRKSAASEMSLKNRSKSVEDGKEIDGAEMMT